MNFKDFQICLNHYGFRIGIMNHYDVHNQINLFILITQKRGDKYFRWEGQMNQYKIGFRYLINKIEGIILS